MDRGERVIMDTEQWTPSFIAENNGLGKIQVEGFREHQGASQFQTMIPKVLRILEIQVQEMKKPENPREPKPQLSDEK